MSPRLLRFDAIDNFRDYGDYATANSLGVITYLISSGAAIIYLKRGMAKEGTP